MENFKVNLNRPEPDKGKIQAKKDFKSFHTAHFPKPTVFKSKWFWGVSGIASIAVVVTVTMSSFSSSPERMAQNETQELNSAPKKEIQVPSRNEISNASEIKQEAKEGLDKVVKEEQEAVVRQDPQTILEKKSVESEALPKTKYKPSVKELFELDFDANEFPNLQVGNNLFYIHPSEQKSSNDLFAADWDDVDLQTKNDQIYLTLVKNGVSKMFKVVQYIK